MYGISDEDLLRLVETHENVELFRRVLWETETVGRDERRSHICHYWAAYQDRLLEGQDIDREKAYDINYEWCEGVLNEIEKHAGDAR
jgi:trimethylamine:corrinoid methyltransferase-like protein